MRNLYVEFDNARVNKNYTLVAAMGALGLLGIVRKVKLSYLKVGHSHCDGDGVIGVIGRDIINENMPTFETFRDHVKRAFRKMGTGFNEVYRLVGITDYKTLYHDIRLNPHGIQGELKISYFKSVTLKILLYIGISTAHCIRIVPQEDGKGLDVHYLEDFVDEQRWFPRPAPTIMDPHVIIDCSLIPLTLPIKDHL